VTSSPPPIRLLLACKRPLASDIRRCLEPNTETEIHEQVESLSALRSALDAQTPDLLVCELQLDQLDALEAIAELRSRKLNVPVVLLARTGVEEIALRCLEQGVDQFVTPDANGFRRLPMLVRNLFERAAKENSLLLKKSELRESHERYIDVFDNTSDLIQCLSADGRFLYTNRAWRETMGYTEEEVESLNLMDVLHPDSQPCCQDRFNRLQQGEELSRIHFKFLTKSGEVVHLTGDCGSLIREGEAVSTRGIFKNVTDTVQAEQALRASEARYQTLYEHAPDIYTTISRDGTILSINRTGAAILGYCVEELINRSAASVIHPDDLPVVLEHMGKLFAGQESGQGIEYRKVRKDGSLLWVHQRASLDPD